MSLTPDERVWKTLNHEEPDRIPIYEGIIETPELHRTKKIVHVDLGLLYYPLSILRFMTLPTAQPLVKFFFKAMHNPEILYPFVKPLFMRGTKLFRELGIDMIGMIGGLPMILNPKIFEDVKIRGKTVYSPSGNIATIISPNGGAMSRYGFLRSESDYEKYIQFDPDHPLGYCLTSKLMALSKGKIALNFNLFGNAYFESMCNLFGFETLFRLMIKEPHFIERVVRDLFDYSKALSEHLLENGAKILYMTDDLGYRGRSLVSPKMYAKFFTNKIREYNSFVHRYGGKVFRHSDGNIMDLMPYIIQEKNDALHPWESDAGMNIMEGKVRYGKDLTVVGSVPIDLLTRGTKNDVKNYVKQLCQICGPGGGYIISSSHSITPTCQWQNYATMLWTVKKFGKYPIMNKN